MNIAHQKISQITTPTKSIPYFLLSTTKDAPSWLKLNDWQMSATSWGSSNRCVFPSFKNTHLLFVFTLCLTVHFVCTRSNQTLVHPLKAFLSPATVLVYFFLGNNSWFRCSHRQCIVEGRIQDCNSNGPRTSHDCMISFIWYAFVNVVPASPFVQFGFYALAW